MWLPEFGVGNQNISALLLDLPKVRYLPLIRFCVNLFNIYAQDSFCVK